MSHLDDMLRESVFDIGGEEPYKNQAWILTPQDAWYANPHYVGPPVRHPEDDGFCDDDADLEAHPLSDDDIPY